jgi:hypothetical protein
MGLELDGGGDGEERINVPLLVGDSIRSLDNTSMSGPIRPFGPEKYALLAAAPEQDPDACALL